MKVGDIMTRDVVTVRASDTLKGAARLMSDGEFSGLPVVDDGGQVVGIVTEGDFVAKEADRGRRNRLLDIVMGASLADATTVEEIMTPFPAVIDPDRTVSDAARELTRRGVKRLPVVNGDGVLVGILARSDIVTSFARSDADIVDHIERDLIDRVLGRSVDDFSVRVVDGVVTLRGSVETASEADLLVALIERLQGVVDVDSHLRWPRG